jgi:hypothetical protein
MGGDRITFNIDETSPIDLKIGDYIIVDTERYRVNSAPSIKKISSFQYQYTIIFESTIYDLYNKVLMHEGATEFTYFGSAQNYLELIINNAKEINNLWSIGNVEDTSERYIEFSNESCRSALTRVAQEFGLEYRCFAWNIDLVKKVGFTLNQTFQYGRGKGLYSLERNSVNDKNVITKLYAFGGEINLPADYDGKRLKIAPETKNTDIYGVKEAAIVFDDVFPSFTGAVDSSSGLFSFVDLSIDFDLNNYLVEGVTAKVVFKSGALAGNEFEIIEYDNTEKRVRIKNFEGDNGYVLPNELNHPEPGDRFTFVDIHMPESYITAAEASLKQRALEYLNENASPRVIYEMELDPYNAYKKGLALLPGDEITLIDDDLGIDTQVRVVAVSSPLNDAFNMSATIADFIPYTIQEIAYAKTVETSREVKRVDRTATELARKMARINTGVFDNIFDPDGYLKPEKISPTTIQTIALQVGSDSLNFNLRGVVIEANYQGNANAVRISGGELIHNKYTIQQGYTWDIGAFYTETLLPSKNYYLYARCSKSQLSGTWILIEQRRLTEHETGFWHFSLGILFAENEGYRDFSFTNGMTYIVGDTITTGRIKSLDTLNYFDLTQNKFKLGDGFSGIDWNVSNSNKLTIKGGLIQSPGGDVGTIGVFRGAYQSTITYYPGDEVQFNGKLYYYKWPTASTGSSPTTAPDYWDVKLIGQKGEDGQDGQDGLNGQDGVDGAPGAKGDPGPFVTFRGVYSDTTTYTGSALRLEIVKYGTEYFVTKETTGTITNIPPSSLDRWQSIGAQFSSVATGLLLAELAYIENLGVRNVKTSDTGKRLEVVGDDNTLSFYNDAGVKVLWIDDEIDSSQTESPQAGIRINNTNGRTSYFTANGHFSNASGLRFLSGITGIETNASVVGLLSSRNDEANGISAGIVGIDGTSSGASESYGGYFNSLYTAHEHIATKRVTSNYTIQNEGLISCYAGVSVYLPLNPKPGRKVFVSKSSSGTVYVYGNGISIRHKNESLVSKAISGTGNMFIFDGLYWIDLWFY